MRRLLPPELSWKPNSASHVPPHPLLAVYGLACPAALVARGEIQGLLPCLGAEGIETLPMPLH